MNTSNCHQNHREITVDVTTHFTFKFQTDCSRLTTSLKMLAYWLVLIALSSCLAEDYTVIVGAKTASNRWLFHDYFPGDLWIHPGDKVTWKWGAEIHTVTFLPRTSFHADDESTNSSLFIEKRSDGALVLNPLVLASTGPTTIDSPNTLVSSGTLNEEAQEFSLTFTEVGTYPYINLYHPTSSGAIHVIDEGIEIPSPGEVDSRANETIQRLLDDIVPKLVDIKVSRTQVPPFRVQNGDRIWTVRMVGQAQTYNGVLFRFTPENTTVCEGDIVEWVNDGLDIHSVTFAAPGELSDFLQTEGETAFFSAEAAAPSGNNNSYTGGFINSGVLWPLYGLDLNPFDLPHSYRIRFAKAGEYSYFCIVHEEFGMIGKVIVVPKTNPLCQCYGGDTSSSATSTSTATSAPSSSATSAASSTTLSTTATTFNPIESTTTY